MSLKLEDQDLFLQKINVEFIRPVSRRRYKIRFNIFVYLTLWQYQILTCAECVFVNGNEVRPSQTAVFDSCGKSL